MLFTEDQNMIQALATKCSDQAFNIWVLPGRPRCKRTTSAPAVKARDIAFSLMSPRRFLGVINNIKCVKESLHARIRTPERKRKGKEERCAESGLSAGRNAAQLIANDLDGSARQECERSSRWARIVPGSEKIP